MLGYDLYSSALADILSEPTMQPPICVGLYAQWGSGKSFLLKKLEGEYGNGYSFTEMSHTAMIIYTKCSWLVVLPLLLIVLLIIRLIFLFPLVDEMKTFAGQQIEPLFQFSWLVVFLSLILCGFVALLLGFTVDPKLAIAVSLSLLALLYLFFGK